jgi:hypothetical protein
MSRTLAAWLDPHLRATVLYRSTLATLPQTFRTAPGVTADGCDVAAVSGRSADWPAVACAAMASGVRGLLCTDVSRQPPGTLVGLDELCRRVADTGVAVVVHTPWASHPAVSAAASLMRDDLPAITFVHGVFTTAASDDLPHARALDQLALVRTVAAPVQDGARILAHRGCHEIAATANGVPVHLTTVTSDAGAEHGEIWLLGPDHQWRVEFPDTLVATAPRVSRAGGNGTLILPAIPETALRASWRLLHRAVTEQAQVPYGLSELCADLRILQRTASTSQAREPSARAVATPRG